MPRVRTVSVTNRRGARPSSLHRSGGRPRQQAQHAATWLERTAIIAVVLVAWIWIMMTVGMLLYHGYLQHDPHQQQQQQQRDGDANVAGQQEPQQQQQQQQRLVAGVAALFSPENFHFHFTQQQQQQPPKQDVDESQISLPVTAKRNQGASSSSVLKPYESPLLIFTCNREQYLQQTLQDIAKYIPRKPSSSSSSSSCLIGCPIIISQDGNNPAVEAVIQDFARSMAATTTTTTTAAADTIVDGSIATTTTVVAPIPVVHLRHKSALRGGRNAYQALAIHYGWALQQVMDGQLLQPPSPTGPGGVGTITLPQRVIVLEEDLHIAADFFDYFAATAPLLDQDRSLLAVSAFSDNGFTGTVHNATRLLRSDFFPGLGWMMTAKLWRKELQPKGWAPNGYWDDWLREPAQRQHRQIIRPEVSRTYHFGEHGGASQNQFGDKLRHVHLNDVAVNWSQQDLSYLQPHIYEQQYGQLVMQAALVDTATAALKQSQISNVRLEYTDMDQFRRFAQELLLMDDEKAGVPRTAYKGIVETQPHGYYIVFLTPPLTQLQESLHLVTS